MKKITVLFLLSILFFSGCGNIKENGDEIINMQATVGTKSILDISKDANILLSVKSVKSDCLELEISNKNSNTVFWSQWFAVEKCDNNTWYQLQEIELEENVEFIWDDILYSLQGTEETTESVKWSNYYGDLSKGNYRIIKAFYFDERNQDEKIYVACEFTIE
ncbi:MAG: immunoglobulin-like domain-containing protein [Huintestinicola sp.]